MEYSRPVESRVEIQPYEEIVGRLDYSTPQASRSDSPVCDIEEERLDSTTLNGQLNSTSEARVVETGVLRGPIREAI